MRTFVSSVRLDGFLGNGWDTAPIIETLTGGHLCSIAGPSQPSSTILRFAPTTPIEAGGCRVGPEIGARVGLVQSMQKYYRHPFAETGRISLQSWRIPIAIAVLDYCFGEIFRGCYLRKRNPRYSGDLELVVICWCRRPD